MLEPKEEIREILNELGRQHFKPATGSRGQGGLPVTGSVIDWERQVTKEGWEFWIKQATTQLHNLLIKAVGLSKTELDQLLIYCKWAEREGTYYGRKDYFEKRHKKITTTLENLIKKDKT